MTEQEKLENVIKGLECCLGKGQKRGMCEDCPYDTNTGRMKCNLGDMHVDALALLKEQEARVMTLSGVRNLKESTPIWLEDVDKKDVKGALFMRDYSGTKCVDFAIVRDWEYERVTADYMDYGIRWRVWTSCPTDGQRRAVKWE